MDPRKNPDWDEELVNINSGGMTRQPLLRGRLSMWCPRCSDTRLDIQLKFVEVLRCSHWRIAKSLEAIEPLLYDASESEQKHTHKNERRHADVLGSRSWVGQGSHIRGGCLAGTCTCSGGSRGTPALQETGAPAPFVLEHGPPLLPSAGISSACNRDYAQ